MAMDFLGQNLEDLLKECGGKFSLLTTVFIAEQMVSELNTHGSIASDPPN